MKYKVKISKGFWRSAKRLKQKYIKEEYGQIIDEIRESIIILAIWWHPSKRVSGPHLKKSIAYTMMMFWWFTFENKNNCTSVLSK